MRITGAEEITAYIGAHPESKASLLRWKDVVRPLIWKNPTEVRGTFRSADFVKDKVVFNVGGNNYRVIAIVHYLAGVVAVRAVLRHSEYDKEKWK